MAKEESARSTGDSEQRNWEECGGVRARACFAAPQLKCLRRKAKSELQGSELENSHILCLKHPFRDKFGS